MPSTTLLRIVLLDIDTDVWCDWCGLPCATTVIYIVELGEAIPPGVHRLSFCESCEDETQFR